MITVYRWNTGLLEAEKTQIEPKTEEEAEFICNAANELSFINKGKFIFFFTVNTT